MRQARVVMAGGLNLADSLWCLHRGFERAGCDVRYVATDGLTNRGKTLRPQAVEELRAALCAGAEIVVWWQPQNAASAGVLAV